MSDTDVRVVSFGYRHGDPPDGAHLLANLRTHFHGPHGAPAPRHRTARDPQVRDTVMDTMGIPTLIEALIAAACAFVVAPTGLPVLVTVGCNDGHTLAPTVAEQIADYLTGDGLIVELEHRDIDRSTPGGTDSAAPSREVGDQIETRQEVNPHGSHD